jgi:hypothetical protein
MRRPGDDLADAVLQRAETKAKRIIPEDAKEKIKMDSSLPPKPNTFVKERGGTEKLRP